MVERMHAEGMPGSLPDAWFAPESRTNDGPGLGTCSSCGHQTHGGVCGYRSVAPDGNGTVTCPCCAA